MPLASGNRGSWRLPLALCLLAGLLALASTTASADAEDAIAPDPQPEPPAASAPPAAPEPASPAPAPAPQPKQKPAIPSASAPVPTPPPPRPRPPPPPPPPPPITWKAHTEIGFIQATSQGDTTQNFKGKLHWEAVAGNWAHEVNADALTTHDDNSGENTERYIIGTKSKRSMTHLDYLFAENQWQKDGASIYDYQAFTSAGYGRYLIKTEVRQFNMEIGAGLRHSEPNAAKAGNDTILNFNTNYH